MNAIKEKVGIGEDRVFRVARDKYRKPTEKYST